MKALGTPLRYSATKVMLLGAGELGKEVIIALQRLGAETIAVDRYDNAPGQQVAHHAYTIDMNDEHALRTLIETVKPDIIVPEIEAIATHVLAEFEHAQALRVIPTARATQLTMDREGIRRLAAEALGVPTSPYAFCESLEELTTAIDQKIGYPCVIKPLMSSSGKGQSKISSAADIESAWNYAMDGGRVNQQRVIVEGFIDFEYEITLLTVRSMAQGQVVTSFCAPIGHRQVDGDYVESWQPQPMSEIALQKAQDIARTVTQNLGGLGVFGVELFVRGDEVWFSEVSPRPHDTGMVTMATQAQSEFELHARAILGLPVDTSLQSSGASSVIYGGIDAGSVIFEYVAQALLVPQSDVRLFGKPQSFERRRMGVALATGEDIQTALDRAKQVSSTIQVKPA